MFFSQPISLTLHVCIPAHHHGGYILRLRPLEVSLGAALTVDGILARSVILQCEGYLYIGILKKDHMIFLSNLQGLNCQLTSPSRIGELLQRS